MPLSKEHSDPGSLKEQENSTREGTLITVPVAQGWEENSRDMQTEIHEKVVNLCIQMFANFLKTQACRKS